MVVKTTVMAEIIESVGRDQAIAVLAIGYDTVKIVGGIYRLMSQVGIEVENHVPVQQAVDLVVL